MIPIEDEINDTTNDAHEQQRKLFENRFNYAWSLGAVTFNSSGDNSSSSFSHSAFNYGSRTDKPQMAHEIYKRLLMIASSNGTTTSIRTATTTSSSSSSETVSSETTSTSFNKNAILIAAYSGCKLMYRQH